MATSSIVSKTAMVLDLICARSEPLSFTQVAKATGLQKSATHRILSILREERLVAYDAANQTYSAGNRLTGWAAGVFRTNDLPALCESAMEQLSAQTGAHVALSILDGTSVLYLKTVDAREPYRMAARVGERSPLHATAAGKVMLAHQSPAKQEAVMAELALERYTEFTVTTVEALNTDLANIRARGFALCDREEFLQVAGISAPIFGAQGTPVGAISLWDLVERHDIAALCLNAPSLQETCRMLSERLGHGIGQDQRALTP